MKLMKGIPCPSCNATTSKVLRTSKSPEAIKRQRQCTKCNCRFITTEVEVLPEEKKGRRRRDFADKIRDVEAKLLG